MMKSSKLLCFMLSLCVIQINADVNDFMEIVNVLSERSIAILIELQRVEAETQYKLDYNVQEAKIRIGDNIMGPIIEELTPIVVAASDANKNISECHSIVGLSFRRIHRKVNQVVKGCHSNSSFTNETLTQRLDDVYKEAFDADNVIANITQNCETAEGCEHIARMNATLTYLEMTTGEVEAEIDAQIQTFVTNLETCALEQRSSFRRLLNSMRTNVTTCVNNLPADE